MNNVFYRTLLSQAEGHLKELPTFLHRVRVGFIPERSMDGAIHELQEALKLVQQARKNHDVSSQQNRHMNSTYFPLK